MKFNNLKGSLILILAALIWGLAFVAQDSITNLVPPFCLNAFRGFIAAIALYIFLKLSTIKKNEPFFPDDKTIRKKYYIGGIVCGAFLAFANNFQQFGLSAYPNGVAGSARAGFITALYVILVPIFSIFSKKKISFFIWISIAIAISGVYLLCFTNGINGFYFGDVLVFLCAVACAIHIIAVDKFVGITGGIKLSIMQFLVCGVLSTILSIIFEANIVTLSGIKDSISQILYLGIMSSGVAYTLQLVGQKFAEPAIASISMSLESVFAALFGWIILSDTLSFSEILGCVLVFVAITVAQLPSFVKRQSSP